MTAPLTPHDHWPSVPLPSPQGDDARMAPAQELKNGALTAVLVAVAGVLLGLLWLWLAPRVPLISDGKAVYLKDTEGEQAVGGDGTFVLLGLGMGVLTGALAFWRVKRGGVGVVLGLAAGAVLGSVIAWRLGISLGPSSDLIAHAKAVGPKKVFDGPLQLQAKGALLAWPVGAVLTHLLLTLGLGPRDPEPPLMPYWDTPASHLPPKD